MNEEQIINIFNSLLNPNKIIEIHCIEEGKEHFEAFFPKSYIKSILNIIKGKNRQIKTLVHTNKTYKGIINKKDKEISELKEKVESLEASLFEAEEFLQNN